MRRKEANSKWASGKYLKTHKFWSQPLSFLCKVLIHVKLNLQPFPYIPISKHSYRYIYFSMFFTRHDVHSKIDMMDTTIYHRVAIFSLLLWWSWRQRCLIIYTFPARAHHALFSRLTVKKPSGTRQRASKRHRRPSIIQVYVKKRVTVVRHFYCFVYCWIAFTYFWTNIFL